MEEEFLGALYKGGELLASGKIVEAREHLEKAHGLAPKNEKAQNLLGLTYFKLGLFDQASEVYEKLVNENPTDATLRVNLGLVYLKTNNLERCIKEFETATDLEPTHKKAHNYLGLALAQQGTYGKAKEHFELAGSDQMAEKMGRALAAQASPSGVHKAPAPQAPMNVVLGEEAAAPAPAPVAAPVAAAPAEEEPIEVMSDEEVSSDAYVVPEEAAAPPSAPHLGADWGRQARPPLLETRPEDLRFAEDEGPPAASPQAGEPPVEELPVLDGVIEASAADVVAEPAPAPEAATPAWLTMEAAEASREQSTQASTGWVTETVAEVPLHAPPAEVPLGATDARWGEATAAPEALAQPETATEWVTQEAPPPVEQTGAPVESSWGPTETAAAPADETSWATEQAQPPAAADETSWATEQAQPPAAVDETSWATEQAQPPAAADETSWATEQAQPPAAADETSWATEQAQPPAAPDQGAWTTAEAPADAAWAAAEAPLPTTPDDTSWATGEAAVQPAQDEASWATAEVPAQATSDDASWATAEAPLPTTPDDESWATGAAPPQQQWATDQAPGLEPAVAQPVGAEAQADALPPEDQWVAAAAPLEAPRSAVPAPEPSAPLHITVEEPQEAPRPAPLPVSAPAGYAPMSPQRLVDLGASGSWVHEPSAGPFHISTDGLAVTVAGEMMVRMLGLVAIVGSVEVKPENKRRRGRSSAEPFGTGAAQLQRVSGNGVLYLEPGRSKFHAVDLTDQNGVAIDDDGAYLREEMVFAFEEAISFENGRLSAEGQTLDLAHLKGNGRVLLQLDGTLRAMPIPVGAPMVVPLHRVVGWFGRVSPRLMGFGGRGAVELTGEGYALLGTPAEGR